MAASLRNPAELLRSIAAASLVAHLGVAAACSSTESRDETAPISAPVDGGQTTPTVDAAPVSSEAAAERRRELLSQTGLYADIAAKTLARDLLEFQPAYVLWSDAADKKRWIRLPAGTTFDTTDPDHWKLPVGGQLFKEFSRNGKRLETRLVERVAATGKDEVDYWLGAFAWRDDESDADFVKQGRANVRGTTHDVPSQDDCWACHHGEPGHMLGVSAVQLTHTKGGVNLGELRTRGLVPSTVLDQPLQGSTVATRAIGYLHANCGHCHNINGAAWPDTSMVLRIAYGDTNAAASAVTQSIVGGKVASFKNYGYVYRIEPGFPDESAIVYRMSIRAGDGGQMPPLATEIVDPEGIAWIRDWVESLPPRDAGTE